ncbi:MAG: hypothetical protein Kow0063_38820 [Anaerolineae bacterium]
MTTPKNLAAIVIFILLATFMSFALLQPAAAAPPEPTDDQIIGTPISLEPAGDVIPAYAGCGGVMAPPVNADYEQEVVELVNARRAANGLPPLKRVTQLDQAARYFATDMGQDDYFDHNTYDRSGGSLVQVCTWSQRIQSYYSVAQMLAENIAAGYSTPEAVMNAWMNSPGHRENILRSTAWEIGVGYYAGDGYYYRYWVQDFGRRSGVYPIVINREAASTESANVSLYIYGQGTWSEMRLRNDDGSWTGWQPFQSTLSWTLPAGAGEHTVWVELRNGSQTMLSNDSIILISSAPSLALSTHNLTFLAEVGSGSSLPEVATFTIDNDGGDILHWTAGSDAAWLVLGGTSGDAPATVDVWVDNSGGVLDSTGEKTATITVTATNPDAANSPQTISVLLHVVEELYTVYLPLMLR